MDLWTTSLILRYLISRTYRNKSKSPQLPNMDRRRYFPTPSGMLPLAIPPRTRRSCTGFLLKCKTTLTPSPTPLSSQTASLLTTQNQSPIRLLHLMAKNRPTPAPCSNTTRNAAPVTMIPTMTVTFMMQPTAALPRATIATRSSTTLPVRTTIATVRATDPTSQEHCAVSDASLSLTQCTPPLVTAHGLKKCSLTSSTPRPDPVPSQ